MTPGADAHAVGLLDPAVQRPGLVALSTEDSSQPRTCFVVGTGAVGDDGFVPGQLRQHADDVGGPAVASQHLSGRERHGAGNPSLDSTADQWRRQVQHDRLPRVDGLPCLCRLDSIWANIHVATSDDCQGH